MTWSSFPETPISLYVIHTTDMHSKHNIFTHFQICKNPRATHTFQKHGISRQSGRDLWGQCALELLPLLESCAAQRFHSGFGRSKKKSSSAWPWDVSVVYFVVMFRVLPQLSVVNKTTERGYVHRPSCDPQLGDLVSTGSMLGTSMI